MPKRKKSPSKTLGKKNKVKKIIVSNKRKLKKVTDKISKISSKDIENIYSGIVNESKNLLSIIDKKLSNMTTETNKISKKFKRKANIKRNKRLKKNLTTSSR